MDSCGSWASFTSYFEPSDVPQMSADRIADDGNKALKRSSSNGDVQSKWASHGLTPAPLLSLSRLPLSSRPLRPLPLSSLSSLSLSALYPAPTQRSSPHCWLKSQWKGCSPMVWLMFLFNNVSLWCITWQRQIETFSSSFYWHCRLHRRPDITLCKSNHLNFHISEHVTKEHSHS